MRQGKVVWLARIESDLRDVFLAKAPSYIQVITLDPDAIDEKDLVEQIKDANILLLYRGGRIPEQALREATKLRLIQTMGQGTDNIPIRIAAEKGILVCNSGGINQVAVAEHALTLILTVIKNIIPSRQALREGKFQKDMDRKLFHQLHGKKVGIIGLGKIGQSLAGLIRAFDSEVLFFDTADIPQSVINNLQARRVSLNELLSNSDVVSIHVPLLEATKHMIGWEQLTKMKPSAFLINTSRGSVIDEVALIKALREKRIAGAGLDVFEEEPPNKDNPLFYMDNVVTTPHIAGAVWENWPPRVKIIWENLLRVWEGKKPHNIVSVL